MSVEFVKVQVMVNGKKQEIRMEKGTSFENNGGIYTVDENGQLKKFDKSSNVWTDASSIEMKNYQWQAFQNVANNDGDGTTYSKADIEQAMAMSGDALDTDMSNNLPSGYKIERSADEVPEGTFAVDVSNGDKKAATLKFSLAEIAELKAASQAREAGRANQADQAGQTPQTASKVEIPTKLDYNPPKISDLPSEEDLPQGAKLVKTEKRGDSVVKIYKAPPKDEYEIGANITIEFEYDKNGRLIHYTYDYPASGIYDSPISTYCDIAYDTKGRITYISPAANARACTYEYDSKGNIISYKELNDDDNVIFQEEIKDGVYSKTTAQYDNLEGKLEQKNVYTLYSDGTRVSETDDIVRLTKSTDYPDGRHVTESSIRYWDGECSREFRDIEYPDGSVVHEQFHDRDTYGVRHRKTTFPDGKIVKEFFRTDGKEISRCTEYSDGTIIEASNGNLETAQLRGGKNIYENGVCTKSDLADEFFTAIDGLSWDKSDLEACINDLTSNNIISVLCAYNSKAGEALEVAVAGEWAYGGSGSITDKINELLAPRIAQAKAQGIEIKGTTPTEIALELAQFDSQMLAEGKWAN